MPAENSGPAIDLASVPSMAEFLDRGFEAYLALVRRAAAHPENRRGADKTWVEQGMWDFQQHYLKAVRRR